MQEQNKVTVRVPSKANRADIKKAFQAVFGVKVLNVNIVNVPLDTTEDFQQLRDRFLDS